MYYIVTLCILGSTNKPIYIRHFSFFPLPFLLSFFPHFSRRFFQRDYSCFSLCHCVPTPNTLPLPHREHDNDILRIFSRTRNRRISGSISINNLQGFRQYINHIPTNVVKTRREFNFLTNGSSELLSNVTQPRLGL